MKKNSSIHIQISSEQKAKLKEKANQLGISLSAFITIILNKSPEIQVVSIK